MANQVRVGTFVYRINPGNDKQLQRRSFVGSSWSRVAEFNGYHILDLLLASNGKDIEVAPLIFVNRLNFSGNVTIFVVRLVFIDGNTYNYWINSSDYPSLCWR